MLTKKDIDQIQKALKNTVRDEVHDVVSREISGVKRFMISALNDATDPLRRDIKDLKKDVKIIKQKVNKLDKKLEVTVSLFDNEITELKDKAVQLDKQLNPPALN